MALFIREQPVIIHHLKPWKKGRPIQLKGRLEFFDGSLLVVGRQFRSPGQKYDGLDDVQEPGDHGIVELRSGGWISRRVYLREDGRLIGELYNVQTATRFREQSAHYIDLEIDVGVLPNRADPVVIQDVDELDSAEASGHIPGAVATLARGLAEELASRLRYTRDRGPEVWDIRPEPRDLTPEVRAFLSRA